jgi:hypothetical protein
VVFPTRHEFALQPMDAPAGLEPHEVRGPNKDAEAPTFSAADHGLEADPFTAVPELTNALP